jgi:hypothetical protein
MVEKSKYGVNGAPGAKEGSERAKPRDIEEMGREVIAAEIRGLQELRLAIGPEFRKTCSSP